jgi:hypothetical protein
MQKGAEKGAEKGTKSLPGRVMDEPRERPISAVEMVVTIVSETSPRIRLLVVAQRPIPVVRSTRLVSEHDEEALCLACGQMLPAVLSVTGSIRCQDCREDMAPLCADLVEPAARESQAA